MKIGLAKRRTSSSHGRKFSKSDAMVNFFKETSLKPNEANPILEEKDHLL